MRRVNFEEYRRRIQKKAQLVYVVAAGKWHCRHSRKKRESTEEMILANLDYYRWKKAVESGAIVRLGPRRYRYGS